MVTMLITVEDLINFLSNFPPELEVVKTECSDYQPFDVSDISVIKAVDKDFYWMGSHPTMSEECKSKEKEYLHFSGN